MAKVTATFAGVKDPQGDRGILGHSHWSVQGADAGLYSNDDIHAIRIVILEPNTEREGGPKAGRLFYNHAHERMRILGEFPVRHFVGKDEGGRRKDEKSKDGVHPSSFHLHPSGQPLDPDGNPVELFEPAGRQ